VRFSFAGFDTFAFAFAIGDSGGQVDVAAGALLIGTLMGGAGLAIAFLRSWTRWRVVSLVALVCALLVLPAAVLYARQSANAFWVNTHPGMHYGPSAESIFGILQTESTPFKWLFPQEKATLHVS
jgi:hypothetical protein